MSQRTHRHLDAREVRVLGCLLEKEQATPEAYPLTLNALLAACNQRSNRNPVLQLSERDVRGALERLLQERLVRRRESERATRWNHELDGRWRLDARRKAAITVLLLRGPQTAGEVRGRTKRMHAFGSTAEAEAALVDLAAPPEPLVMLREREPGQKEPRWAHCVASEDAADIPPVVAATPPAAPEFDPERVMLRLSRLEQQVQKLEAALLRGQGSE